jgi:dimethylaniline monooxygenase (N-oxide forming)
VEKERVYPGFRSQGGVRTGGFSDVKFEPPEGEVDDQDFYMARTMADYLDGYANQHEYSGTSLRDRIHFGIRITELERLSSGWMLHCTSVDGTVSFKANKVLVATGSTSVHNMPEFKSRDTFGGPIVHTLDYGRSKIYERKDIDQIAIVGGGKSAADMAYESVKAGRRVKWIVRKSGKGPGSFLSPKVQVGSIKSPAELALVRFFPSILVLPGLQKAGLWQRFLYNTRLGAWVLEKVRQSINDQSLLLRDVRIDREQRRRSSF